MRTGSVPPDVSSVVHEAATSLLEAAPDAIVAVTAEGRIVLVNAQTERLFGYPRAELVGQPVEILVPEAARAVHPGRRAEYVAASRPRPMGVGMQLAGRRRDGSLFPAEISLSAIDTSLGRLFAAAVRDVTDRIQAEARFQGLLEAAPDAIVGVNRAGTIVLVNAQTERLFGYPRADLVGQPLEMLVPEYARDVHPGHRGRYLAEPQPRPMGAGMELAGRRADGTLFPAEISLSAIGTGDQVLVSAAIRDVTDRKRAEAQFRGLLESAPDAIVGVTPDGRISLVNAQTERLFGYPREELLGQPVEVLVPDHVRSVHPDLRTRYFADPDPRPMGAGKQLVARRRDGSQFPAEISLSALETEDGLIVSAAIRDVTERSRFEQRLQETNLELERASRAKDNFLASMSHELRTPLNAIIGFTGILLMQLPGPLNPEQGRHLRTVENNGKHLLAIINDLLDLAKIESGKVEIKLEPVDCNAVVTEVTQSLGQLATEKGLGLTTDLTDASALIHSDRRALGQILINLVNNAIKFTDTGTVRVAVRPLEDGHARIDVCDTGPGIAEADQARIFEAFDRGGGARPGDEGTGLGLHICHKLAELIGATISLHSRPGHGATFTITSRTSPRVRTGQAG